MRVEVAARDIAALGSSLAPRLKELGELIAADLERALWPDGGAPEVLSWTMLWERQLDRLRASTDDLVRRDVEDAAGRGQPWPSGASIRAETAARVARAEEVLRQAEGLADRCPADLIVFGEEPPPAPLRVAELFATTAVMMLTLAHFIEEGSERAGAAHLLIVLLKDVSVRMASALHTCGRHEAAAELEELAPELMGFEERLDAAERAAHERPPPVVATAGSGDASAALLERLAAEVRRIAPTLADAIEGEIFDGSPPRRVSFQAIQVAIDTRLYGEDIPSDLRRLHEMVADADRILIPDDDEPLSARELLDGTASSIEGAVHKLRSLPPSERDEMGSPVELQARLFVLGVVAAAHATHRQLLVAELACAVGLNPIPFPDELEGGGSA